MKKLILAYLILISIGCKKEIITPAPTVQTVSISYTQADSVVAGNWILDKTEELPGNGGAMITTYHTDPVNCILNLSLVPCTIPGKELFKDGYGLANCSPVHMSWECKGTSNFKLYLNGSEFFVEGLVTSTHLQLGKSMNSQSGAVTHWYLHK